MDKHPQPSTAAAALRSLMERIRPNIEAAPWVIEELQRITGAQSCTSGAERLKEQVFVEIGYYSAQCAKTGELAPSKSLLDAVDALAAVGQEAVPLSKSRVREIFVANGFTVKEGQTDLKPYVYAAAEEILRAAATQPQAVPTPARKVGGSYQADGHVVVRFKTRAGLERVVFEFAEPAGMLHIFDAKQVEPRVETEAVPSADAVDAERYTLDTAERVCFYEQEFYVLSNFSSFGLEWEGRWFPTSEHAYHWEKFYDGDPREEANTPVAYQVMNAPSAHEAFKIAERNKALRRPDWDTVKVDIMRDILRAKAQQHEYVRRKLLETGERELVENSWRDDFWGWGPDRNGQNMLGRLWMDVRAELRADASRAPTMQEGL